MGLGGVGDSKGMLESELRERHIEWLANSRIVRVDENEMVIETLDGQGQLLKTHTRPFAWSMIIPAFAGVDAVAGLDGLVNDKGVVLLDKHQRTPTYATASPAPGCGALTT